MSQFTSQRIRKQQNVLKIRKPIKQIQMSNQFDFSDVQIQAPKKNTFKASLNESNNKKNKNGDFFDQIQQQIPKVVQKRNKFQQQNLLDYFGQVSKDTIQKMEPKKSEQKHSIILPKITQIKPKQSTQKRVLIDKMDLGPQQPSQKQKLSTNKESQQQDYAIYGDETDMKRQESKAKQAPFKLQQRQQKKVSQPFRPKIEDKIVTVRQPSLDKVQKDAKHMSPPQADIKQQSCNQRSGEGKGQEQEYEQDYEQQIQDQVKQRPRKVLQAKKERIQVKPLTSENKQAKPVSKLASPDQKINKYKQMFQKSFPNDQTQDRVRKLKHDAINRLNDKMRDMIKGFSAELTGLIEKNLNSLKRNQNQINQQIEGQPIDPLQAKIKVLQQTKRNNEKALEISQRELQTISKTSQKVTNSLQNTLPITEEIQTFKRNIAIESRQINTLRNQVEKQGRKVTKLEQNKNQTTDEDSRLRGNIQTRDKLAVAKLQLDRNKRKLQQLSQKLSTLQQKHSDTSYRRTQILQMASAQGISFHSKQSKVKYQQLKKKHALINLFQSKFKSSIKSKQTLIQRQITDAQTLIYSFQQKLQELSYEAQESKQKMLEEIRRANRNPKLNANTKEVLSQLQLFMNQDKPTESRQKLSQLKYISDKIYNKDYRKNNLKSLTQEKQQKKIAYKNYIQAVSKINEENRLKIQTQRRSSQHNPFRKVVTLGNNQSGKPKDRMHQSRDDIQNQQHNQRVWKSSNTQNLLRNPLKRQNHQARQNPQARYQKQGQLENPLKNKQIMNLIQKNKSKIILKQEAPRQQTSTINKKPFSFKGSVKQKQTKQQASGFKIQPKQTEKYNQNRGEAVQRIHKMQELIAVKLKDKQVQMIRDSTTQSKPPANSTPFINIKLRKDKNNEDQNRQIQSKFKNQPNKLISQVSAKNQKQSVSKPAQQQESTLKPKRFNIRKRNQNSQSAYMPLAQSKNNAQTQNRLDLKIDLKIDIKKDIKKAQLSYESPQIKKQTKQQLLPKKKQEQDFNPFKKFIGNAEKQQKIFSITINQKPQLSKINESKQNNLNSKPRLNLFKKLVQQVQQGHKKLILLSDPKNQKHVVQQEKFINPYANKMSTLKQQPTPQRQVKIKKFNPSSGNTIKPISKNIFGDVEDFTLNNNIISIGQPEQQRKINPYVSSVKNQEKQPDLNQLLGIKKKKNEIDKDLLIDLPNQNLKVNKNKNPRKNRDFFGDLEI